VREELQKGDAAVAKSTIKAMPIPSDAPVSPDTTKSDSEFQSQLLALAIKGSENMATLNQSIAADPTNFMSYESRARTCTLIGNYEQALADAGKMVELKPEDATGHVHCFFAFVAAWSHRRGRG